MERELVLTPRFRRAYRRYSRHGAKCQRKVDEALTLLRKDAFDPSLRTHGLRGELGQLLSCSCGYDCRIVFTLEKDPATGAETIVLQDVGTHGEVY